MRIGDDVICSSRVSFLSFDWFGLNFENIGEEFFLGM